MTSVTAVLLFLCFSLLLGTQLSILLLLSAVHIKTCLKISAKMPSRCCVPSCFSSLSNGPKVPFYKFPTDPEAIKKWVENIPRKNFYPLKNARICERHFLESDFVTDVSWYDDETGQQTVLKTLKSTAIPTIFPVPASNVTQLQHKIENFEEKMTEQDMIIFPEEKRSELLTDDQDTDHLSKKVSWKSHEPSIDTSTQLADHSLTFEVQTDEMDLEADKFTWPNGQLPIDAKYMSYRSEEPLIEPHTEAQNNQSQAEDTSEKCDLLSEEDQDEKQKCCDLSLKGEAKNDCQETEAEVSLKACENRELLLEYDCGNNLTVEFETNQLSIEVEHANQKSLQGAEVEHGDQKCNTVCTEIKDEHMSMQTENESCEIKESPLKAKAECVTQETDQQWIESEVISQKTDELLMENGEQDITQTVNMAVMIQNICQEINQLSMTEAIPENNQQVQDNNQQGNCTNQEIEQSCEVTNYDHEVNQSTIDVTEKCEMEDHQSSEYCKPDCENADNFVFSSAQLEIMLDKCGFSFSDSAFLRILGTMFSFWLYGTLCILVFAFAFTRTLFGRD